MGYTTQFEGSLKFKEPATSEQFAKLSSMFGEDCGNHPEWDITKNAHVSYIDLELTRERDGIEWDGSEKTYEMCELVNIMIREMQKTWPEFGLTGELLAQGEDTGDVWFLRIGADGFAKQVPVTEPTAFQIQHRDDDDATFLVNGNEVAR